MDEAVTALQAAETQSMKVAERDGLSSASRELLKNKAAWATRYPADLLAKLKANAAAAEQVARASGTPTGQTPLLTRTFTTLSADNFSLVNDAQVSQAIEAGRLLQQMLPAVDLVLAELNTLISPVQGLPNVRPECNPLRPEVFAQALREMIFTAPVSAAFNELNALAIDDAQPFGKALASLDDTWDTQDRLEQENCNRVLNALRFAEDRQSQADQIAFGLSTRSDLESVPGIVLDFLFGPWALAMAHASLADTPPQAD